MCAVSKPACKHHPHACPASRRARAPILRTRINTNFQNKHFVPLQFFISLFIFEISHSCIFKAVERTLYEGLPAACEAVRHENNTLRETLM